MNSALEDRMIEMVSDIKIDAGMSVSTLYALETILFLRLQLAQVSGDEREPAFAALCRERFEQILNVLKEKYPAATTVSEKIEILERIKAITLFLSNEHSNFALDEASMLENLPDRTYAQKLRLKWLPNLTSGDDSKIVAKLLPHTGSSFEMATLALISDFCTDKERAAIFDRYIEMFDAALSANDTAELGNLLALAAYWNNSPSMRSKLTEAADKAASIDNLSLPEKRVNQIAAEIYEKISILSGKTKVAYYEDNTFDFVSEKGNVAYYGIR